MNIYAIFLVVYLIAMLVIGFVFKNKAGSSTSSYFIAGRGLGYIVLVATMVGTALGGSVSMGTVGMAYNGGFYVWTLSLSGALGYLVLAFMAGKLYRTQATTTPDILAARYGQAGRYVASFFNILFNVIVVAGQIMSIGIVLQYILGIDYTVGMLIATVVFVVYTLFGGMYAVAYTDVIQSIFVLFGLFYVVFFILAKVGGFGAAMTILEGTAPEGYFDWFSAGGTFISSYFIYTILGIVTMQIIHQRIFAAKSEMTAKRTMFSLFVVIVIVYIIPPIIGMAARVLIPGLESPQNALPILVVEFLPPVAGAIVFISLISIMMSTADSTLLSIASNIVKDFYLPLTNKEGDLDDESTDKRIVRVSKICVIIMALVSLFAALNSQFLVAIQIFRLTVCAGAIAVPLIAALYWKRATQLAGVLSMIFGGGITLILEQTSLTTVPSIFISVPVSFITLIVVSYLQKAPENVPEWVGNQK